MRPKALYETQGSIWDPRLYMRPKALHEDERKKCGKDHDGCLIYATNGDVYVAEPMKDYALRPSQPSQPAPDLLGSLVAFTPANLYLDAPLRIPLRLDIRRYNRSPRFPFLPAEELQLLFGHVGVWGKNESKWRRRGEGELRVRPNLYMAGLRFGRAVHDVGEAEQVYFGSGLRGR